MPKQKMSPKTDRLSHFLRCVAKKSLSDGSFFRRSSVVVTSFFLRSLKRTMKGLTNSQHRRKYDPAFTHYYH